MTLCINQVPVDFTLEDEATLADLETSLKAWAQAQNLTILSLLVDGKASQSETRLLAGVSLVEVEVVTAQDEAGARIAVVVDYLGLAARAEVLEPRALEDLKAESAPVVRMLAGMGLSTATLEASWDHPSRLAGAAQDLLNQVLALGPRDGASVAPLLARLETASTSMGDLSALFQKGQDREAFDRILAVFTDLMGVGVVVESSLGPSNRGEWDQFQGTLRPFLKEAEAAMAAQDYVLLTDLMEYEIGPRLSELRPLVSPLFNLDPGQGVL